MKDVTKSNERLDPETSRRKEPVFCFKHGCVLYALGYFVWPDRYMENLIYDIENAFTLKFNLAGLEIEDAGNAYIRVF